MDECYVFMQLSDWKAKLNNFDKYLPNKERDYKIIVVIKSI